MAKDTNKFNEERPCYYITDGLGIDEVAYVANPAILSKGIALNEVKPVKHRFADNLKLQVAAPVLIPDLKIYRKDDELGEYDVVFSKERIVQLHTKQKLEGKGDKFNLDHDSEGKPAQSVILYEWIIQNPETDLSVTQYGLDALPQGTLFRVTQFAEEQRQFFMKEIVEAGRTGFSIEGYLGLELEMIKQKIKQNKMKSKIEEIKLADGSFLLLEDGKVVGKKAALADDVAKEDEKENPSDVKPEDKAADNASPEDSKDKVDESAAPAKTEEKKDETAPVTEDSGDVDSPEDDEKEMQKVMSLVKPMFDEVYKQMAEIKTMVETMGSTSKPDGSKQEMKQKLNVHVNKIDKSASALAQFFRDSAK